MTQRLALRGFVVEQYLGRGASGDVWRARADASGDRVALKRIRTRSVEQRERALREGALLTVLDHPSVVRLYRVVPTADSVVLVLDLADAGSLAELLQSRGRLTPGEVVTALAPIAAALAYLHGRGVTHGDVSAANVLFAEGGVPMLADVGVARLVGDVRYAEATPSYVDPALADGGMPGPASDVFALGGVALHALTGIPPWPGRDAESALSLARAARLGDVAARLTDAGAPPEMAAVIARALTVDPHRRGTAADFALELRHSTRGVAVELSAGRPTRGAPGEEREPPTRVAGLRPRPVLPRPSRRLGIGRIALTAAAVVTGIVVLLPSGGTPSHSDPSTARPEVETKPTPAARIESTTWASALRRVDREREVAFARRDERRLRRIYSDPILAAADAALLRRVVPVGCGLVGVRTRYTDVVVHPASRRATLLVTATLAPSHLVCGRRVHDGAAGVGPTRLRVLLVQTASGPRIAGQAVVSAAGA